MVSDRFDIFGGDVTTATDKRVRFARAGEKLLALNGREYTLDPEVTAIADDNGVLAAMLALHLPKKYLDQLFVAPEYQGRSLGRMLLAFTRQHLPDEIELRCARENDKAWRWYEREGFVLEKEAVEPMTGFVMKYYRWKKKKEETA